MLNHFDKEILINLKMEKEIKKGTKVIVDKGVYSAFDKIEDYANKKTYLEKLEQEIKGIVVDEYHKEKGSYIIKKEDGGFLIAEGTDLVEVNV